MLGFSLYLNEDITPATEQYINRLKKYGFNGIFTSVHIPEEDSQKYRARLLSLGNLAKKNNLDIMVDIDQASLEKLNISLSSLDSLKEQGITGLRIDDRLAPEQIADLSQKIEIGINGSTFTEEVPRSIPRTLFLFFMPHLYFSTIPTGSKKQPLKILPDAFWRVQSPFHILQAESGLLQNVQYQPALLPSVQLLFYAGSSYCPHRSHEDY